MSEKITEQTIEAISILAKLTLSEEEKQQAMADMEAMLQYIDQLNDLDTEGVEPMSHVFPVCNVYREDEVQEFGSREGILKNAPAVKNDSFQVPKTID